MTTKLHGKFTVVEFLPTGGTDPDDTLTISAKSRNFKLSEKASEIDVTVREDVAAGTKDYLTDAPERTASLSGLDTDENAPDWEALEIGDMGTLSWYRRGKGSGKPKKSAPVRVTSRDLNSPHDNANDWSVEFKLTGAITPSTQP